MADKCATPTSQLCRMKNKKIKHEFLFETHKGECVNFGDISLLVSEPKCDAEPKSQGPEVRRKSGAFEKERHYAN